MKPLPGGHAVEDVGTIAASEMCRMDGLWPRLIFWLVLSNPSGIIHLCTVDGFLIEQKNEDQKILSARLM